MILHPMILPDGSVLYPVHFLYHSPRGTAKLEGVPIGPSGPETWKVSCMPYLQEIDPNHCAPLPFQRSEDWRAVTCPWCKQSVEWQKASGKAP